MSKVLRFKPHARSLRCSPKPQHRATATRQSKKARSATSTRMTFVKPMMCLWRSFGRPETKPNCKRKDKQQASGTRRNSDKQTLTLKYFKFTDKLSWFSKIHSVLHISHGCNGDDALLILPKANAREGLQRATWSCSVLVQRSKLWKPEAPKRHIGTEVFSTLGLRSPKQRMLVWMKRRPWKPGHLGCLECQRNNSAKNVESPFVGCPLWYFMVGPSSLSRLSCFWWGAPGRC